MSAGEEGNEDSALSKKVINSAHEDISMVSLQSGHGNGVMKKNLAVAIHNYVILDNKEESKKQITDTVEEGVQVYQKSLTKIFERYAGNAHLPAFKNKVEALTLTWLLLLNKDKLHLGELGSNLYDLLLDMVEKLSPEFPRI